MESLTKNRQPQAVILRMTQKAFGSEISLEEVKMKELTEGFYNAAYDITLRGQSVILKIAPPIDSKIMSYEKNIMDAEVRALRMVKEEAGLPVPKVYYYDTDRTVCEVPYFFMEKLDGESFFKLKCSGMPQQEQDTIMEEAGSLNRKINQLRGSSFGYLGQTDQQGKSWKETFLHMIHEVLSDGERIGISLGVEYSEVYELIQKSSSCLNEVMYPALVHWDLWDGNVFVKDGRITGMIDFERALWGDPLMEYFFRRHSCNNSFNKGYGADLRLESPVRALLYDIYLYLIMTIETKYRNYEDDGQYHFASKELKASMEELQSII